MATKLSLFNTQRKTIEKHNHKIITNLVICFTELNQITIISTRACSLKELVRVVA